jgi:tetratricopeptide (TPR) repeat protein
VLTLLHIGDRAAARKEVRRFLDIPNARRRGNYDTYLGIIAADEGRYGAAIAHLAEGARVADQNAEGDYATARLADRAVVLALWGRKAETRAALIALRTRQSQLSRGLQATFAAAIFVDDLETARSIFATMTGGSAEENRPMLAAGEARRRGDPGAAVDAMDDGPPDAFADWYVAQCALEAGRLDIVERSAKRLAGGGYAYFTVAISEHLLGRVEEARGNRAAAKKHYQKVVERWRNADPDLPELVDAKARLARL